MDLEKQLHEELKRHHSINNYGKRFIGEQEEPADPTDLPTGDEPVGDAPVDDIPSDEPVGDAPVDDIPSDDPVDDAGGVDVEEVDITDLVNMTQNIKNELDAKKGENDEVIGKMGDLFSKLDDLESKLSQMDNVIAKIDGLEYNVNSLLSASKASPTTRDSVDVSAKRCCKTFSPGFDTRIAHPDFTGDKPEQRSPEPDDDRKTFDHFEQQGRSKNDQWNGQRKTDHQQQR